MLSEHSFGHAGDEVLVEEFMQGEEISVFALSDGKKFAVMLPAQDHKRLLAGDQGPNTGGMGAYAPVSIATDEILGEVADDVVDRTLWAMRDRDEPFRGLLYCGLMLTADGAKVVEFNCRFGDPETQAVVPLLESDLLEFMIRCAKPGGLSGAPVLQFAPAFAVTTVVAAPGYPESARTGSPIRLPDPETGVLAFHAGTARNQHGELVTAGGRVLALTGLGATFDEARRRSLRSAEETQFDGKQYRSDIGWRELERHAGAA
jgi:phosphoribosylamine--glycine ligase